jgi:hypothetical protein
MGIFDSIKDAIFGKANAAEQPANPPAASQPQDAPAAATPTPATPTPSAAPSAPTPAPAAVDIEAVLEQAVATKGQKLNWRTSIVDFMKALDLDSSLAARKELAKEFGYTGDANDSATMNVWLHNALMKKLAENGGKVPADLKD